MIYLAGWQDLQAHKACLAAGLPYDHHSDSDKEESLKSAKVGRREDS